MKKFISILALCIIGAMMLQFSTCVFAEPEDGHSLSDVHLSLTGENVLAYYTDDFDGDGNDEALALIGDKRSEGTELLYEAEVWFINGDHSSKITDSKFYGTDGKIVIFNDREFLLLNARILVNDNEMKLEEFLKYSCYMDKLYPLFSTNKRIDQIVAAGISKNKLDCSPNDVRDMFGIDSGRFQRPLRGTGNEKFKMMAAIGYVYGKEVFCFPWMSQKRFYGFHGHLTYALEKLEQLGKTVILPLGVSEYDPDKV